MKKNLIRIILIILLIYVLITIFNFSNQNSEESSGISRKITQTVVTTFKITEKTNFIESIIRKIAHFTIYAVLGFLVMSLVSTYRLKELDRIGYSQIFGTLYAISDEIHQSFIPGRSSQITDVILDSLGVLLGILLVILIIKIIKLKK